ncbi:MAG TPA: sugar kinase [Gemmataceae bacterium]|jgi:sugar/nucleoside kinase (ribokinase family)|nr:sugar kinase [Gemmataceae bacterium]
MKTNPDVLCAGIIVADHVCHPVSHVPAAGELVMTDKMLLTIGGCAANAAVDLTKMEVSTAVVGRVGDDAFGRIVAEMLREQGVDTTAIQTTPGADTSQTLIVNVAGQDRRFIHTFGANAVFSAADISPALVKQCRVLYLGGYLAMPRMVQEELAPLFAAARQAGAKTVLDVVVPGPGEYLSRLDRLLPHVDVFLPNNHEAQIMTGETDPVKQAEVFRGLGAKTVVITMGSDGSVLVTDQVRLRAGVFSMPLVDASGGGDAFDAGFIYGLLKGMMAEECLRVASALGASCVRAIGTTPGVFTQVECEEFLRKNALRIDSI